MHNVKPILGASLTLTLICAVVVAALAGTNLLTADTIAEQEIAATNAACATVLPQATSFELIDGAFDGGVTEVYRATSNGETVGLVVKTVTVGKSSGLTLMTGITADGVVSGVQVVEDQETAGYVDTVVEGGLLDRLTGATKDTADVAAVSMATKTSNGIKAGVKAALAVFEEVNTVG